MNHRLIVIAALTLATAACGSETPTTPTQPTPPPTQASADVRSTGQLSFPSCSGGQCNYQGQIVNNGPDCAQSIHGVTHLFDENRNEIAAQQWTASVSRLRPTEQFIYSGCCFRQTDANMPGTYRTDVFFDAVRCS